MNGTTRHTVVIGDARTMGEVPDSSVHLIVTSPPYWQLKDYGSEQQLGFHDSYENYINHLNLVWGECYRVLHDGCRLCVNIGDQFARAAYYGRYKVIPIREEIIKFCEIIGFDYMGAIIWQKVTTTNTTGGASIMGSFPYPRNGILKLDYEFILLFKKQGIAPKINTEAKKRSSMTTEEWNTYFAGHWNFSGERQDAHLAMFPEELPRRLIKMFSFCGETVLDPFLGSGTTALAAKNLGRNSIGYEINPTFADVIERKVRGEHTSHAMFDDVQLEMLTQRHDSISAASSLDERLQNLPYLFRDPHILSAKVHPKQLQFGSRVDATSAKNREEFFTVKEVVSPALVRLNNERVVRLLGIKELPAMDTQAREFLMQKTKGQRVFIRYDNDAQRYDDEQYLLGYLYLQNKTFLNAHLIKKGLASVDEEIEFRYKQKFITLFAQHGTKTNL